MDNIVNTRSAVISNYKGYDAFVDYNNNVWLGLQKNYDNHGHYNQLITNFNHIHNAQITL